MTFVEKWEEAGCPKCSEKGFTTRECDEVNAQAVGPYTILTCENCGYEDYCHA